MGVYAVGEKNVRHFLQMKKLPRHGGTEATLPKRTFHCFHFGRNPLLPKYTNSGGV
jgi:hypothetical protein